MSYALRHKTNNIFRNKSKPSRVSPSRPHNKNPNNNKPPIVDGWTEKAGSKGQYLARTSVTVNYKGTDPKYQHQPQMSKMQNDWLKKQLENQSNKNDKVFEGAIAILSQSPTGRDLLQRMTDEGYEIVFDDRRTKSMGAGGLCDPTNKKIILGSTDDPEYLALVIGHEAVHAVQYTGNSIFPNSSHTPQTAMKLSFAIEADAYAQQTQIALELKHGDPNGPKSQWKMDGPLQQMRKRFKNIVEAAEKTLTKKENLQNGAAVAAAFEGFYDNVVLRSFYEDAHINWANQLAPQIMKTEADQKRHFYLDLSSDDIASKLIHKGQPYLKQHTPNIDFSDARHSGLTEDTQKRINTFYSAHRPNDDLPKIKTFGVHVKDSAKWIFGRNADTSAVIMHDNKIVRRKRGPRGPKM